jgi:dienelactone hydrolase
MQTARDYTSVAALWARYDRVGRSHGFDAPTVEEWAAWHDEWQPRLLDLLGGLPERTVPLDPAVLWARDEEGYRLEKVAFQSEPGQFVPCYVLIPRAVEPPYRPVIALHGHGTGGAAHILGLILDEATRAAEIAHIESMNYDYARQLARRGFLVFAPEQRGFGERMEPWPALREDHLDPLWQSSCASLSFNAMLQGKTAIGLRVWDLMRTIDYVHSRPESLVGGLGCLGLSGGGTITLFGAALDSRITVAVVSGYFNTFRDSIMAIRHCACNYVPRLVNHAEMSDIAGLIAPRPLLIESGAADPIFPIAAAQAAYTDLQRIYEVAGVPDRLAMDAHPGPHRFSGRLAFDWLDRWL